MLKTGPVVSSARAAADTVNTITRTARIARVFFIFISSFIVGIICFYKRLFCCLH